MEVHGADLKPHHLETVQEKLFQIKLGECVLEFTVLKLVEVEDVVHEGEHQLGTGDLRANQRVVDAGLDHGLENLLHSDDAVEGRPKVVHDRGRVESELLELEPEVLDQFSLLDAPNRDGDPLNGFLALEGSEGQLRVHSVGSALPRLPEFEANLPVSDLDFMEFRVQNEGRGLGTTKFGIRADQSQIDVLENLKFFLFFSRMPFGRP